MNIRDAVSFVGKRFQYMKDPKIYIADLWYIMKKSDVMVGDCEDFALTSIWYACNKNIFTFILNVFILHRYRIYFAKTRSGGGHAVGYANGYWFDNFTREALSKEEFLERTGHKIKLFFPSPLIMIYMFFGLFYKFIKNR